MSASFITVQLIPLRRLPPAIVALCETLRREAGRCWTDIVQAHVASRDGVWLTDAALKAMTKGGRYRLHSQSIQALCEKLIANVDTTRTLREQERQARGEEHTRYPHHAKPFQTVTRKGQAIRVASGLITLPNGRAQPDLVLPLPTRFHSADIRQVELLWRVGRYELALTIAQFAPNTDAALQPVGQTAGVDMGEIHVAAVCTEGGQALVVSGRRLRHQKQLRNKRHAAYRERLDRCRKGSRRWTRLKRQMTRASAKLERQQRDLLHQASRKVIIFAIQHGVTTLAIGDVRDIADGVALGRRVNQKVSQWPHGQMRRYLTEKGVRAGMTAPLEDEAYSTRTCSCCGTRLSHAPRGRVFACPGCGAISHRDANAAANICSNRVYGTFGRVQVQHITHRRAIVVRAST